MERGADRNTDAGRLTGSGPAIGGVELAQIARNALLDLRHAPFHLSLREVVVARVHRLELAAVDRDARFRQQCACGDGTMSRVLEETGQPVRSTDLYDRGFGE